MIELRPFAELGGADHGWLKGRHHFSFAKAPSPIGVRWATKARTEARGGAPSWGARPFPRGDRSGWFVAATLKAGEQAQLTLAPERHAYLVASSGTVDVLGVRVGPRDGAAITDVSTLDILCVGDAELVLVDAA